VATRRRIDIALMLTDNPTLAGSVRCRPEGASVEVMSIGTDLGCSEKSVSAEVEVGELVLAPGIIEGPSDVGVRRTLGLEVEAKINVEVEEDGSTEDDSVADEAEEPVGLGPAGSSVDSTTCVVTGTALVSSRVVISMKVCRNEVSAPPSMIVAVMSKLLVNSGAKTSVPRCACTEGDLLTAVTSVQVLVEKIVDVIIFIGLATVAGIFEYCACRSVSR
jgi:hypothetical protein